MKHLFYPNANFAPKIGDSILVRNLRTNELEKAIVISIYGDQTALQCITKSNRHSSERLMDVSFISRDKSDLEISQITLFGALLNLNEETKTLNAANKSNKVSCCFADAVFARNQSIIDDAFQFIVFPA